MADSFGKRVKGGWLRMCGGCAGRKVSNLDLRMLKYWRTPGIGVTHHQIGLLSPRYATQSYIMSMANYTA